MLTTRAKSIMKNTEIDNKTKQPVSLEDRIHLHYNILRRLEEQPLAPTFAIAPICSSKMPFIELNVNAIKDLYNFSKSSACKKVLPEADSDAMGLLSWEEQGIVFESIFEDNRTKRKAMNNLMRSMRI